MDKAIPLHLQEIIYSSSDPEISRTVSKLVKDGKLRKIAPKIYTPNFYAEPSEIIRRNLFKILGHLYPGILLSHRSALEFAPTPNGELFLTYTYDRKASLPGITLSITKGHSPLPGDNEMSSGLFVSQRERALLENLQESRKSGVLSKTLEKKAIEEKLETVIRVQGEKGLNELRDKARIISEELNLQKEYVKLNSIIGALLTTHTSSILTSPLAQARAFGHPYDPLRIQLFEKLFTELQQRTFADILERNTDPEQFRDFAFYEAYFSNFIEGTRFDVEDARQIIETQKPLPARNQDSHDVLGTYQIVSNRTEMSLTPSNAEQLIDMLRYRHKILMSARPDKLPGNFKDKNNFAGDTTFVDFNHVLGTINEGFNFYRALSHPFAKAAYMMFMISEIHPFLDGNGRIARIMMNAELVKEGQSKIIIPTVFREDYLGGLRQLTRRSEPDTYIKMLQRAQLFSSSISGISAEEIKVVLEQSNAFKEGDQYILKISGPSN
ncbi:Fic/DOC family protein [compost metagenome]